MWCIRLIWLRFISIRPSNIEHVFVVARVYENTVHIIKFIYVLNASCVQTRQVQNYWVVILKKRRKLSEHTFRSWSRLDWENAFGSLAQFSVNYSATRFDCKIELLQASTKQTASNSDAALSSIDFCQLTEPRRGQSINIFSMFCRKINGKCGNNKWFIIRIESTTSTNQTVHF